MTARRLALVLLLVGACASERSPRPPLARESRHAGDRPAARKVQATRRAPRVVDAGPPPAPTARQSLECPIDPGRAECRALCAGHATHEWCR